MLRRIGRRLLDGIEWLWERLEDLWVVDKPEGWKPPRKDPRNRL